MRVDMVGPVLRIILDYEDCRLRPRLAVADRVNQLSEGHVTAGDTGGRRKCARPGAGRVVLAQAQYHQARKSALPLEFAELFQEDVDIGEISLLLSGDFRDSI